MAFNTGNPIGSSDPRDLYDNAQNLDELVNSPSKSSQNDRRGNGRKTWHGMEQEFDAAQADKQQRFNQLLAASGFVFLDDYAAGIVVNEYNEVIRDASGNLWRAASTTALPHETTGTGMPEGGAFVSAGDAVLRNDLIDDPANGQGALNVRGSVIYVDTIADLQALPTSELVDGQMAITKGTAYTWQAIAQVWSRCSTVTADAMGLKGDGSDETAQLAELWSLASSSNITFGENKTYRSTTRMTLVGQNIRRKVDLNGSTINCDEADALLINNVKQVRIENGTINGNIVLDGFWYSKLENLKFDNLITGRENLDTFESHYWSRYIDCEFKSLEIHTGESADRTEFNSNYFENCNIWHGDYAIKLFGSQFANSITFNSCDLSYYDNDLFYVDNPSVTASFTFIGGYLDSSGGGIPLSARNVRAHFLNIANPNSSSIDERSLYNCADIVESKRGVRSGSSIPVSGYNLVKNGDIRQVILSTPVNISGSSGTAVSVVDGEGLFGRFASMTVPGKSSRTLRFTTIPAPYSGEYTFTCIAKTNKDDQVVTEISPSGNSGNVFGVFAVPNGEWAISHATRTLQQGETTTISFSVNNASEPTDIQVAYLGCSFGSGNLGAVPHPSTIDDYWSQLKFPEAAVVHASARAAKKDIVQIHAGTGSETFATIYLGNYAKSAFSLTLFCYDKDFPESASVVKKSVAMSRGTGAANIAESVADVTKVGSPSAPVLGFVDNGGTVDVTVSYSAGTASIALTLDGIFVPV